MRSAPRDSDDSELAWPEMDRKAIMASNGGGGGSSSKPASSNGFRRILPAFATAAPAPRSSLADGGRPMLPGSGSSTRSTVPPKNVHVKAACDACRKRKVKVCLLCCCLFVLFILIESL